MSFLTKPNVVRSDVGFRRIVVRIAALKRWSLIAPRSKPSWIAERSTTIGIRPCCSTGRLQVPVAFQNGKKMEVDYQWNVRVVSDGSMSNIFARNISFQMGKAISFDAEDPSLTALEAFLGAIGCDLISGMQKRAKRLRLEVDNIEANLKCELENPLMFLDVVGEKGSPAIKQIAVRIYVSTVATRDELEVAWQKTLELSPLYQTLKTSVRFELSLKLV